MILVGKLSQRQTKDRNNLDRGLISLFAHFYLGTGPRPQSNLGTNPRLYPELKEAYVAYVAFVALLFGDSGSTTSVRSRDKSGTFPHNINEWVGMLALSDS